MSWKITFSCALLLATTGCYKEVQWHRETYVLDRNPFLFDGKQYSFEQQTVLVGNESFVGLLPQTKWGYRDTSYKGPYKIKFVLKHDGEIINKVMVTTVKVYDESSERKLLQIEGAENDDFSLIKNDDLGLSSYVFDQFLNVNFDTHSHIIVAVKILFITKTDNREYELLYRLIPNFEEGTTNIPLFTT